LERLVGKREYTDIWSQGFKPSNTNAARLQFLKSHQKFSIIVDVHEMMVKTFFEGIQQKLIGDDVLAGGSKIREML